MNLFLKKTKIAQTKMPLEEVTALLSEIRVPTSLVFTPTNLASEKEKFFASDTYNPQFEYKIVDNQNSSILRKLSFVEEITDVDPRISQFYLDLIKAKSDINDLMEAVGDNEKFTEISMRRFRMPSPVLFRNASRVLRGNLGDYKIMNEDKYKKQHYLEFDEIAQILQIVFDEIGLKGWSTEKSLNIAKNGVKVGVKKKEVLMDPNIKKRPYELRKTIIHEFTHIIRAYNGELTGYEALSKANLPEYLDIEEGLAVYNEEMLGVMKKKDLIKSAAKVWAIHTGKDMSFRQLYNTSLAFLPKNAAFEMVYRVKRGLGDTSKPGIYARDISYFRGFRRVRNKIQKDPSTYATLFAGKISFKQLSWVEDGLIRKPKLVPQREVFERAFKKAGI